MKGYPQSELHFDEKELKVDMGQGNFIFVGSSCDMWAECALGRVPSRWIASVLNHCIWYEDRNRYLFQSKNPARFKSWNFPQDTILGTTIESNYNLLNNSNAPNVYERMVAMASYELPKMISIEPIMDFDFEVMLEWIRDINPEFVSIGADSKGHKLPEPGADKLKALIDGIQKITEIRAKNNLDRLMK